MNKYNENALYLWSQTNLNDMNKIICAMAFAASLFAAVSCSSDKDEPDGISKTSLSMYSGETEKLTAIGSGDWATSDRFVAEVSSDGTVKASHVGTAFITHGATRCEVEVKAKYDTYVEPLCKKGATMSEVRAYEKRELFSDDAKTLIYLDKTSVPARKGYTSLVAYTFTDGVLSSCVYSYKPCRDITMLEEVSSFLKERYQVTSTLDEQYSFMFLDAYDADKVKTIIGLYAPTSSNKYTTSIIYAPNK